MRGKISDTARLQHIKEAIEEIEMYLDGFKVEKFLIDSKTRFATIKQLEIIGEAASKISTTTKDKAKEIDWKAIVGLRNILVHEYFGVNLEIIWDIATSDIPDLKKSLLKYGLIN